MNEREDEFKKEMNKLKENLINNRFSIFSKLNN
jgi:hypothetical protein